MRDSATALWRDEDGLTTVEYALLLALMVTTAVAGWRDFGQCLATAADEPMAAMQGAGR